jgi:hypothetical protein
MERERLSVDRLRACATTTVAAHVMIDPGSCPILVTVEETTAGDEDLRDEGGEL